MDIILNVENKRIIDQKRNERHELFLIFEMAILGLLTIFVETMLVPALPIISKNLAVESSDLAWVLTAYTLAGAISIPIFGKLGETWGRKRILLIVMTIYIVGLIGAAISWDLPSLIISRTLQGIGMSAIALLMGMAKDALPLRMVPVGMGIISAMIGVGAALGLVIGGLLISTFGWKDIFWIVLPVVVLMVGIVYRSVPDMQVKHQSKLDPIGSALLGAGLLTLLLALSRGSIWGWGSILIEGLFVCSILVFIVFYFREKTYNEPIIRFELLKNRNIMAAYVSMFFIGMVMFMLYQTLPYFLEMPRDLGGFDISSQVTIGLFLLPNSITMLIFSIMGGKVGLRIGHGKILIIGLIITAVGLLSLSLLRSSEVCVLITMAVFGTGLGLATVGNSNLISCACSRENFGSTTAVNSMIQTIGMSVGPVVAGLIVAVFADASTGYAYGWGIAALLAVLAAVFVLMSRANLGVASDSAAPCEERSRDGEL
jgi:MFS family permease